MASLGHELHRQQRDGIYTDIVIVTEQESFHAHRSVLAADSAFWNAMFAGGFKERKCKDIGNTI